MASRRAATIGLAVALLLGVVALVLAGIETKSRQVQTLGVTPVFPIAPIAAGGEACENAVSLADPLERVRFNIGTFGKPGPPLDVAVRAESGLVLGAGHVKRGWVDNGTAQEVPVGRVEDPGLVSVCVRNRGPVRAYVYGNIYTGNIRNAVVGVSPTVAPAYATVNGIPVRDDISLRFMSEKPRSLLTRVPDMFRHAEVFRPGVVGAWTYWVLLAFALVGAPLLLWRALIAAVREDSEQRGPAERAALSARASGRAPR